MPVSVIPPSRRKGVLEAREAKGRENDIDGLLAEMGAGAPHG